MTCSTAGKWIEIIKTPIRPPKATAIAERFVQTARTESLDWLLIMNRRHLERLLMCSSTTTTRTGRTARFS